MKVIDISDEIHRELGSPTDLSIPSVNFWLRGNIGKLNARIFTEIGITDNGSEISPELNEMEKTILKKMYFIYFYEFKIRENLGAAAIDSWVEVTDAHSTVRRTSKNEL